MSERKTPWREKTGTGVVLFLLLMARACAFGVRYYPQLDDYIQYHNYLNSDSFAALQELTGLLASRPLAGLADYFLWGRMFGCMIVGVALISLLWALTALLFWDILERYFRVGPIFPVLMTLLPLGMEGTYWMSASTRVVVGMFFAALAARVFLHWLDVGNVGWFFLYLGLQLLPFGFYEQAGILSVTLTVGAAVLEWTLRQENPGRCAVSLWGAPAMGLYFLFTNLMASGSAYSSRAEIILPVNHYYWAVFLPNVVKQFRDAFLKGGFLTLAKGFVRSARMIVSGQLLLWTLAVLGLSVLLWGMVQQQPVGKPKGKGGVLLAVLSGTLLAVGPVSLFLLLENPWFSLRSAVTSFPGLALVGDAALMALWDLFRSRRNVPAVLAAAMAFVFCVAGASEVKDYRDTYENDQRIAALTLDVLLRDGFKLESDRVGILNVKDSYLPNQNFFFHEHIHGCTQSGWAFTGLLKTVGDTEFLPPVTPLPAAPMYQNWNRTENHPSGFSILYWFDGESLTRAELVEIGENTYQVQDTSGKPLGRIWEEDGNGYLHAV